MTYDTTAQSLLHNNNYYKVYYTMMLAPRSFTFTPYASRVNKSGHLLHLVDAAECESRLAEETTKRSSPQFIAERAEKEAIGAMFATHFFTSSNFGFTDTFNIFSINGWYSREALSAFATNYDRVIAANQVDPSSAPYVEYCRTFMAKAKRSIVHFASTYRSTDLWCASADPADPYYISPDLDCSGDLYTYRLPTEPSPELYHENPMVNDFFRCFNEQHPKVMAFTQTPKGRIRAAWKVLASLPQLKAKSSMFPCKILEFLLNFHDQGRVVLQTLRNFTLIGGGQWNLMSEASGLEAFVLRASKHDAPFFEGVGFSATLTKVTHRYFPETNARHVLGRFYVELSVDISRGIFTEDVQEVMRWAVQPASYLNTNAVRNFTRTFGEHQLRLAVFVSTLATGNSRFLSAVPEAICADYALRPLALLALVMHDEEVAPANVFSVPYALHTEDTILAVASGITKMHFERNGLNSLTLSQGESTTVIDDLHHELLVTLINGCRLEDLSPSCQLELLKAFVETSNVNDPHYMNDFFDDKEPLLNALVKAFFDGELAQLKVVVLEAVLKASNTPACSQVRYRLIERMVSTLTFPLGQLSPGSYSILPELYNVWYHLIKSPQSVEVLTRFSFLMAPVLADFNDFDQLIQTKIAEVETTRSLVEEAESEPLPLLPFTPNSKRAAKEPPDLGESYSLFKRNRQPSEEEE